MNHLQQGPATPPRAVAVEVVATQPSDTDREAIAHLSARDSKALEDIAYLVKIRFEEMPAPTGQGWALYVDDQRIPKYWGYTEGIYFKVLDPQFFVDHDGGPLRFSLDGTNFIDTGLTLKFDVPKAKPRKGARAATPVPTQADALTAPTPRGRKTK
jgi:hypothetical protein